MENFMMQHKRWKIWFFLAGSILVFSVFILLLMKFGQKIEFSIGKFTPNYTAQKYYYHESKDKTELSVSDFKGTTNIKKQFNSPGILQADISEGEAVVRIGETEKVLENKQPLRLSDKDDLKIQGEFSGKIVYLQEGN